ncbi:hypothetical protein [Phaffia rhodozyma]|uniref:Uncharacterized protein n=1 Tax=Phaffia rhodozyma TaxID=264483 RepID=A0A0F7SPN0_PHARH|nr:hypothetical protein [Phaffia rhodozyma]
MLRRISVHATSIVNILTRPRSSSYLGRSVSSAILRPFVSPQQKKIWVNRLVKSNGSDRESAERELRWIGEEISRRENSQGSSSFSKDTVERMIAEREDGTPLQYVLGFVPLYFPVDCSSPFPVSM